MPPSPSAWTATSSGPAPPPAPSAAWTRRPSTRSCGRWSSPASSTPSTSPSWPWQETGFGVFEDKVLKNYIATEFLYDYLKDKRTVGVIGEDPERNIQEVAEPIGVVLGLLPITNPTSTALFKSIVAAKTRNAIIFRPVGARRRLRPARDRDPPGGRRGGRAAARRPAGDPRPDARRLAVPLPSPRRRLHLDDRRPQGRPGHQRGGQAVHGRRRRQRARLPARERRRPHGRRRHPHLQDLRRLGHLPGRADPGHRRRDLRRRRRRARAHGRARARPRRGRRDRAARLRARRARAGQRPGPVVREPGGDGRLRDRTRTPRSCSRRCPPTWPSWRSIRSCRRSSCRSSGIVRSPSVEHGIAACELVTEHGGLGHTSAVYAQDETVIARFAEAIRTGRILVNAPTAVGALGGVYNALTPTFSLGCGTWGGSTTTDNVNYRNLLNVKVVSRRQAPPQWFRVPSDTYFNTGAIESLRQVPRRPGPDRDRCRHRGPRGRRRGAPPPGHGRRARVLRPAPRAERGRDPRRRAGARPDPRRPHRRGRRRLGHRRRQGHPPVPRAPRTSRCASWRCRSSTRASASRSTRRSPTRSAWWRSRRRPARARRSRPPRC